MASFTQVSTNNPVRPSLPLYLPNVPTHLTLPIQLPSNFQSTVLLIKLPTMQSPAFNFFPNPLSHKYFPPHSILRYPQYMFLIQYKATSLCPYINRQIIFLFIKFLYIFGNKMEKYILEKM